MWGNHVKATHCSHGGGEAGRPGGGGRGGREADSLCSHLEHTPGDFAAVQHGVGERQENDCQFLP